MKLQTKLKVIETRHHLVICDMSESQAYAFIPRQMAGAHNYAKLFSKAPELLKMLIKCTDMLASTTEHDVFEKYQLLVDESNKLITEATTL